MGRPAGPTEDFLVPVRARVRRSTFAAIARAAAARGMSEERFLSDVLERLVVPALPREGLAGTAYSETELERMRALHADRLSDAKIAAKLGRSQPQVSRRLRQMGLPPNGRRIGTPA